VRGHLKDPFQAGVLEGLMKAAEVLKFADERVVCSQGGLEGPELDGPIPLTIQPPIDIKEPV
jgi:hypothetical protein